MTTMVTVKLAEKMVGDADVCILKANQIIIRDGLIVLKQIAEDPLLTEFSLPTEEVVGVFRQEDVRAVYRTIKK